MNKIGAITNKNILLLQGPMGYFFKDMDLSFRHHDANTFRIGFNYGDEFFSNKDNYIPYRDKKENWRDFISDFLATNHIDKIFIFGDCRFYQKVAISQSVELNIEIFVFEEGYIRPNFITLERNGVNDHSSLSRDCNFYTNLDNSYMDDIDIVDAKPKYYRMGWSATTYYTLSRLFWYRYPNYEHHRQSSFVSEALFGVRNAIRKYIYKFRQNALTQKIIDNSKNYYFVPLQSYDDFQIKEHSDFKDIESFIKSVILSFSIYAPADKYLVIKHHPMDRGIKNYSVCIKNLANRLGVGSQIIIIHDLHLPTCLKNAIGTITINSTVGISSLYHNTPTIVLGRAIYDIENITCKHITLDDFWTNHTEPNGVLFKKFYNYLISHTQINGSFYGLFPDELK